MSIFKVFVFSFNYDFFLDKLKLNSQKTTDYYKVDEVIFKEDISLVKKPLIGNAHIKFDYNLSTKENISFTSNVNKSEISERENIFGNYGLFNSTLRTPSSIVLNKLDYVNRLNLISALNFGVTHEISNQKQTYSLSPSLVLIDKDSISLITKGNFSMSILLISTLIATLS